MDIFEIKKSFAAQKISKPEFVDAMHEQHKILETYARYITGTEIQKISIEDNVCRMTTRDGVVLAVNFLDKHAVPLGNLSFGAYEPEEKNTALKMIRDGDVVFDIGANYGWYSLNIAKRYPQTKIYAFEPIPATYRYFIQNIALNKFDTIKAFNFGFSDKSGVVEFNYNKDASGATSMTNLLGRSDVEKIQCEIKTIDSFVESNPIKRLDFIKCDIEGAELFALRGGEKTIAKYKPALFVEMLRKWSAKFNYHPNDIIRLMEKLGYHCFEINGEHLSRLETMTEETAATNFFFLHTEKHAERIASMSFAPIRESV